ncbi:AtpZ/AtpI family protein [Desmospora activa]|uniref:AtpZ/AtpI family protein n=1 Tax=Desmospora activa TaxID=500615 RepID=UPI000D327ECC|nr:AtpZ/AtpI family protein [Desmospora activa]
MKKNTDNPWRIMGLIGTLGLEILLFAFLGIWIGKALDERWGTEPAMLLIGIGAGLVLGFLSVIYTIIVHLKE